MNPTPVSNQFEMLKATDSVAPKPWQRDMSSRLLSTEALDIPIEAFIRDPTSRQKRILKERMKNKAKQFCECVEGCRCSGHDGVDGSVGEFPPLAIARPQSEAAERERE